MPNTFTTLESSINELKDVLARADYVRAVEIFELLPQADMAQIFGGLDETQQIKLLALLPRNESADILEELNDESVADLVAQISDQELLPIVEEMEPDKAADLLGDVEPGRVEMLLAELNDEDELRPLMIYPDDSAGGRMTSQFIALRRRMTAADAIDALRQWSPDSDDIYYIFVVDGSGVLRGVLDLRSLIMAPPDTLLREVMNPDVFMVRASDDQEVAVDLMIRYDLLALPVVNESDVLLGIITIDDIVDVLEEETTEDFVHLGGAEPLRRPYLDAGIFNMVGKRIGWLLLLFITATLTGSVMLLFQGHLEKMAVLAIFVPLIIGTGGNAGSQTTATIIRAMATRDVEFGDIFAVWWREARVGFLLGAGMAIAAYFRAVSWDPNPRLGLAVAAAIISIVIWATSTGSILPLVASKLRIDPTVVSGPVMSTIVDATGLFIYFSLAGWILNL